MGSVGALADISLWPVPFPRVGAERSSDEPSSAGDVGYIGGGREGNGRPGRVLPTTGRKRTLVDSGALILGERWGG